MATKIRNTELRIDLASLVKYIGANNTANLNTIELYYDRSEIVWTLPPQAALGSSTVTAIWIGGVRYVGVVAWTRAWTEVVRVNQAAGISVTPGRPVEVTAVNINATRTAISQSAATLNNSSSLTRGTRLSNTVTTIVPVTETTTAVTQQVFTAPQLVVPGPKGDQGLPGRTGAQGPQGPIGATGAQGPAGQNGTNGTNGVSVQSLSVNEQGNLIVALSNSSTVDAGYVVGPSPVLTVGSVTAGATPSVTITGGPTNYTLNFVLEAGPAGSGSGDVSTLSLYDNPAWITSLASTKITGLTASSVGLGNVTNESKATMFASPTFTGTVSGVTATHVGLGNVTNESKATMFASPTFTGTVSGVTATHVGLGNVTNESKATMFSSPTFTGTATIPTIQFSDSTTQTTANRWTLVSSGSDTSVAGSTPISLTNNDITYGQYSRLQIIGSFTSTSAGSVTPYLGFPDGGVGSSYAFNTQILWADPNAFSNQVYTQSNSNTVGQVYFANAFNRYSGTLFPSLRFTLNIYCPGTSGWMWWECVASASNSNNNSQHSQTHTQAIYRGALLTSSSVIRPTLYADSQTIKLNGYWEVHGVKK